MCEPVREESPGACPKCGMDLVRMDRLLNASPTAGHIPGNDGSGGSEEAARAQPLMPGVPDWLFYTTAISILLLSFILFEVFGRRRIRLGRKGKRWGLFRIPGLKWLVKQRWFQFSMQFPVFLLFGVVVYAGLFGNPAPEKNIAPALTWTIWWTWLAFLILFMGKLWCTACPWMGSSSCS